MALYMSKYVLYKEVYELSISVFHMNPAPHEEIIRHPLSIAQYRFSDGCLGVLVSWSVLIYIEASSFSILTRDDTEIDIPWHVKAVHLEAQPCPCHYFTKVRSALKLCHDQLSKQWKKRTLSIVHGHEENISWRVINFPALRESEES